MLPAMAKRTEIAIVGPGRLGNALAIGLTQAGYSVVEIVSRNRPESMQRARSLARRIGAAAVTLGEPSLKANLVWLCVPDREIAAAAKALSSAMSWKGRTVFHSSGALGSDELRVLQRAGAAVAAVHPFMTFVSRSMPDLKHLPFGLEGDPAALRLARQIVSDLGGEAFSIAPKKKAAYHAWGGFTSPLLVSLLVTAEQVAAVAGFSRQQARRWALPILRQTIANYERLGPADAFSGPIVRGDAAVVKKHLRTLRKIPAAREVYLALAKSALRSLPAGNKKELKDVLEPSVRRKLN
jgi:predicted short-subunit dehydrogenase-like oxidoreductase (DUF2520 family)